MRGGLGLRIDLSLNPTRGSGVAPVVFDPSTLFAGAVPGVWYDPSDLSTMYQTGTRGAPGAPVAADLDPVGLMLDKSGNNLDLTQATAGKRPLYRTLGGLSWLQYDGVDDALVSPALNLSAASALGMAIGFQPSAVDLTRIVLEMSANTNTNAGGFYLLQNNGVAGQLEMAVNVAASNDVVRSTSTALGNGVTSVLTMQSFDIAQAAALSKMPIRRNSAALAATASIETAPAGTVFGNHAIHFGGRGGASLFAAHKFFGFILRSTPFSAGELASVEAHMMSKSGV